jgi:acyl-CoA dehydrogenase
MAASRLPYQTLTEARLSLVETKSRVGRGSPLTGISPISRRTSRVSAQGCPVANDFKGRAQAVAATAASNAATVDREARFPAEAIAAAKQQRLLGMLVPTALGGEAATISDAVNVCYVLGRACSSTAMIYAMHQIMVACLIRHASNSASHRSLLSRLCAEQLLLASSTTEGQGGGDLRKSDCAVQPDGARITLEKSSTVMSYGEWADGIVTTARRSSDAPATDQVLVAFSKEDYSLRHLVGWDTLGMRGTCSAGFMLKAAGTADQVLPEPYQKIHAQTMMPIAHLTWSAVWTGIAADAVERARSFVRGAARRSGQLPPAAAHLTRAAASLRMLRSTVASALRRYETIMNDDRELEALDFQTTMNLLKVNASELAISTVTSALHTCGLAGYRNDGEFSVTRQLRDALSAPIMINNDRILGNVAGASLLVETPALLTD